MRTATAGPGRLLAVTVAATGVGLGLATGTGPLVGPVAAEFGVARGAVAVMLAATLAATLGLGVVTGPWSQRHGARPLVVLAAAAIPAGLLVLAVAGSFPVAAAGFALGVGGGAGCLFVPLQTAVAAVIERHRAAALVVASAGAGLATVVTPPATVALVGALGVRGAAVVLAVVAAVVVGACVPAVPSGRQDATAGATGLRTVLAEPAFRRFVLGAVGVCAAMFVPFVHLASFATMRGVGLATGAMLVAVAGAASLLARLAAVPAVARWGAWPVCRVGAVGLTVSVAGWLLADGRMAGLAAFAVVFGGAHGAYVGVSGAAAAELFGVADFGLRLGVMHLAAAAGGLLGPAVAGLAADAAGSPTAGIAVAVACGVAGCAVFLCAGVTASGPARAPR
ncbi:putative MFS family arabinose efflux permease [Actinomycetospora succinea]|uniref:Putative MFS family arabinose efflux permease n=1 Tax=Actinomycetospora succinea TaxID=663603 RepID=A0A4R6V213_9PSEU|nr:MFS transporter [Actinomycetospora succinea]TDQ52643.1 putative MFS family arabinose efflux permease [Actinomycetospora succinea]